METPSSPPRTLADWLRSRSDGELAALLASRPDVAAPVPPDLSVLSARASLRLSVLRAADTLDRFGLELLDALVLASPSGGPVPVEAVLRLVGDAADPADVRSGLDGLRRLALVWGDDSALHVVGAVRDVVGPHPAGLGRPLSDCLDRQSTAQLRMLLRGLGLPEAAERRAALAELAGFFGDADRLTGLLSTASEPDLAVLRSLAAGPPIGQTAQALDLGRPGPPDTPVRWLLARGLLVGVDAGTVELPREVGLALRGSRPLGELHPQPPELDTREVGVRDVDAAAALEAGACVRAVETLLESWGADPPSVLRAGGVGVRDLRRTAKELDLPEATVALLVETAWSAGLLDAGPAAEPDWLPTPDFDAWVALPPEQRWATLASAWLASPRLAGLVGSRDATGSKERVLAALGPDLERAAARDERRRALETLAALPPGTAAERDSLAAALAWRAPRRGGRLREHLLGWTLAEAAVLGVVARGAVSSPGRALLGGDEAGAAKALGPLLPEPLTEVLLQADLTVVAPGPLLPELARELGLVADVESSGGATVYRVTESSVRRALDAGRSAAELQAFFADTSRTPVPQGLSYLVDDVARRHGSLRVGTAMSYLRCDDPALLSEVLAARRSESLRLRRLAPTVAVASVPVPRVLEVLRSQGYAPAAEAADGALVVARSESRRAVPRPRTVRSGGEPPTAGSEELAALVRSLRDGDSAARASRRAPVTVRSGPPDTATTLALLQEAAREHRLVLLGYVDPSGRATSRVVEPVSVDGGYLTAHDRRRETRLTYALHRITGASPYEEET